MFKANPAKIHELLAQISDPRANPVVFTNLLLVWAKKVITGLRNSVDQLSMQQAWVETSGILTKIDELEGIKQDLSQHPLYFTFGALWTSVQELLLKFKDDVSTKMKALSILRRQIPWVQDHKNQWTTLHHSFARLSLECGVYQYAQRIIQDQIFDFKSPKSENSQSDQP